MTAIHLKEIIKIVRGERLFTLDQLSAQTGDCVGVVGRNGAGKTTLAHIINGTDLDYSGQRIVNQPVVLVQQIAPTMQQSGGQAMLTRLRTAFAARPAILILDEPSSNLDENHQDWLIKQIKHYRGLLILISHDRKLLNSVATKIWAVDQGHFTETSGNYADYVQHRQKVEQAQLTAYEYQNRQHRQMQAAVARRQAKAGQIRKGKHLSNIERARSKSMRERTAAKMEQSARKMADREERNMTVKKPFQQAGFKLLMTDFPPFTGKTVLSTQHLQLKRDQQLLANNVSFQLKPGDRLAITGPNGSGKSTLLAAIRDQVAGVQISSATKIAWFLQDMTPLQTPQSLWDFVNSTSRLDPATVRQVLGALGLSAEFYQTPMQQLSGGELVKTQLASALVSYSNCLVLDEPTNYLDTDAVSALTDYLLTYPGAVLFVAHDQVFRKDIATRTLTIKQQQLVDPTLQKQSVAVSVDKIQLERRYEEGLLTGNVPIAELRQLKQMIDELESATTPGWD